MSETGYSIGSDLRVVLARHASALRDVVDDVELIGRRDGQRLPPPARGLISVVRELLGQAKLAGVKRGGELPAQDVSERRKIAAGLRRLAELMDDRSAYGTAQLLRRAAAELDLADRLFSQEAR